MIKENTFASACYEQNTVKELEDALSCGADETDRRVWDITAEEWEEQVELAIEELKNEK